MKKLLIVNPGSTSTKVAVYYGSERKFSETISHPAQELQPFANVLDQADYRAGVIARCLEQAVSAARWTPSSSPAASSIPRPSGSCCSPASPIWPG